MMAFVFKPARTRNGKRIRSSLWSGRYRLDGMTKPRTVPLGVRDKRVAEAKLAEVVKEAEQEAQGILVPREIREAAACRLSEHLAEWEAELRSKGRAERYRAIAAKRVRTLLAECSWVYPADVTVESFSRWRRKRAGKLKPTTLNHYLDAMRAMLNWMKSEGKLIANPLAAVGKVTTEGTVEEKRAFTVDEMQRLRAVSGKRWPAYLTASNTGLRHTEIKRLQWGDVVLDTPKPFIKARAGTTKNKKQAVLPLGGELVDELRKLRPREVSPARHVFHGVKFRNDSLRLDMAKAGIPEYDAQGRKACFHAFRKTFNTNLHKAGTEPRRVMALLRVSDMRLCADTYTDVSALNLDVAVEGLPTYNTQPDQAVKTGTDDAPQDALAAVPSGPIGTLGGTPGQSGQFSQVQDSAHVGTQSHGVPQVVEKYGRKDSNPQPPDP